jgi:hypothetical protein
MAPPKFADLGKAARDLFSKNFHFGVVNVEASTTASNGAKFTTKGKHTTATGGVGAGLECEMKLPYGLEYKESWTTDNVIHSTLTSDGKIADGVKVEGDFNFAPDSGKMGGALKTAYSACDYLNATADVDCSGQVHMSSVLGNIPYLDGWVVGCQASYDTANAKLVSQNIGFEYREADYVIHSGVYDSNKYVGSIHHQISDKLTAGAILNWTTGPSSSSITFCGKYALDGTTFVKAKLDDSLCLGVSYVQNLRDGVEVTLSGLVNGGKSEGGHKIGLSLNFDA